VTCPKGGGNLGKGQQPGLKGSLLRDLKKGGTLLPARKEGAPVLEKRIGHEGLQG